MRYLGLFLELAILMLANAAIISISLTSLLCIIIIAVTTVSTENTHYPYLGKGYAKKNKQRPC